MEAGVVYSSDLLIAHDKVTKVAQAPENLHAPILYPIAVLRESINQKAAERFVELILRSAGQNILTQYGLLSVR